VRALDGVDATAGRATQHHVRTTIADNSKRLTQYAVTGSLGKRQGVVRASRIRTNSDMAGRHIGQILQQPEWVHAGDAVSSPLVKVKATVFVAHGQVAVGIRRIKPLAQYFRRTEHLIGAEFDPQPLVINGPFGVDIQAALIDAQIGRDNAKQNLPTHHLLALLLRLGEVTSSGLVGDNVLALATHVGRERRVG